MLIFGYTARTSDKNGRRYVSLQIGEEIDPSEGRGQKAVEVSANEDVERVLSKVTKFPVDADVETRVGTVRTDYGNRPTFTITGVTLGE